MDKDLYEILQEIKSELNAINGQDLDEKLKQQNDDLDVEIKKYNYLSRKKFLINIKNNILNILSLGLYKYFYNAVIFKENNDYKNILDAIENDYIMLNIEITVNEVLNRINKIRKVSLDKNYDQISNFLSLYDNMNEEEKENILTYKMGVDHE